MRSFSLVGSPDLPAALGTNDGGKPNECNRDVRGDTNSKRKVG